MARLIVADDLIETMIPILSELVENPYIQGRIVGCIDSQPTAYDVDKVVAELQSLSNAEADYYYANSNDVIDRETAVDIVRKGGVE